MPDDNTGLIVAGVGIAAIAVAGVGYLIVTAQGQTVGPLGFQATPTVGTAPLTVEFVIIGPFTATSIDWDFGDGTTASTGDAASVSHTYTDAGTYNASAIVTLEGGQIQNLNQAIAVNAAVSGKTATTFAGGSIDPSTGTTATTFTVIGSLYQVTPLTPLPNTTFDVTLNGTQLLTITTDQYGEFDQSIGTLPVGTNVIGFVYQGDATYDATATTAIATVTS